MNRYKVHDGSADAAADVYAYSLADAAERHARARALVGLDWRWPITLTVSDGSVEITYDVSRYGKHLIAERKGAR